MSTGAGFAALLADDAPQPGTRIALRADTIDVSYDDLAAHGEQVAALLRGRGVEVGDRVAIALPNGPAYVSAFLGALRAGAIAVPLNPLLRPREIAFHLADCGAALLLTAPVAARASTFPGVDVVALPVPPSACPEPAGTRAVRDLDDTAMLLYSSGTTGWPKGVELTHRNLDAASAMTARALDGVLRDAVLLAAVPLFHGYGLGCALLAPLRRGATIVLLERFHAGAALDAIERERASVFVGVPTMLMRMVAAQARQPRDLGSLETCLSGGGALRTPELHACERALRCEVLEGYGASEVLRVAVNRPRRRRTGSVGPPLDGVEVRLVDPAGRPVGDGDVGELEVRAASVMKGYWGNAAATAATIRDGWLRLGDLARQDADGSLSLAGRTKDVILRGGFTVHPLEVEEVLLRHPAVAEAAVVGIADDELGEEIAAAVVFAGAVAEDEAARVRELQAWLREQLAPFRRPRLVWAVDALPRGVTGKVLREQLRADAAGRRVAQP